MVSNERWYRAEAEVRSRVAAIDESGDFQYFYDRMDPYVEIFYHVYPVLKHTPKGVWLDYYGERKFVLKDARKRFACPTKGEALESLKRRNLRRITILRAHLRDAELLKDALNGVDNIKLIQHDELLR